MSDEQVKVAELSEEEQDQRADVKAVLTVFVVSVLMAVHFISGFTIDI